MYVYCEGHRKEIRYSKISCGYTHNKIFIVFDIIIKVWFKHRLLENIIAGEIESLEKARVPKMVDITGASVAFFVDGLLRNIKISFQNFNHTFLKIIIVL